MTSAPDRPILRGREAEMAELHEQLLGLRAGSGGVVILEGAAGLGKSRLIAEAVEAAGGLSVRAGVGVADPSESMAEMAPLLRALFDGAEPLLDRAALSGLRLPIRGPRGRAVSGGARSRRGGAAGVAAAPEGRYWLLQDLQALLERAAFNRPLLICLDDLQWADGGTVAVLRDLIPRLATVPAGWLLATRPDQGSPPLQAALQQARRDGARRLVLDPLGDQAVAQVAADVVQAEPAADLLALAAQAGGNPFLLVELLLGLRQEHLIRMDTGRATLTADRLPARVGTSMSGRLAVLSESARQLATAAASLGRTFSFSDLSAMMGVPPGSLLTAVAQLSEAGILRETGDRLSFAHDLVREAVRQASSRPARRALDRHAADVLLAGGALPVDVASQLAASAEPGDDRAVEILRDAAETLSTSDPRTAAEVSHRALDLTPRKHPRRGLLIAQTTILLHAAGQPDAAKAFADGYLRDVLPADEESAVRLSISSMFALSPDVRAAANRRALELPDLPPQDRARHLARLAYNLLQAGRSGEARTLVAARAREVRSAGDASARSILQLSEAVLLYLEGSFEQSLALHELVMRGGFGPGEATRERVAYQWRCELLAVLDRLDESVGLIADGIAATQRDRQGWAVDFFETWRGRQLFQRGRLSDASAALEGRFDPSEGERVVGALYAAGVTALGRVAIHTDDERRKRETAEVAKAMFATGTPANRGHAAWLLALQAHADSDLETVRAVLNDQEIGATILPLYPMDVTDEPHLVRLALACGDRSRAAEAVAIAERRAANASTVATVQGAAAHARGLFDGDTTELDRAARLLEHGQRPLALASALEDLGRTQLAGGRRPEGLEALGRALVLYHDMGASWDARRVRRRLRIHGVRRRLLATERPERGWEALTESERAVVHLVAGGLTNREAAERLFVSPHTVNSHLRHAFGKLGINSRVELARLAEAQAT